MGLISLLEQFLAILNIIHLFSIQLISPKTFLTHSHFSEDAKEISFNRFNHTKNIFPPCKLLYLRKISRHLRSQKDLKSNKVKKVNRIKIFTSIVKYQKNWDIRYNVEEDLNIAMEFWETFRSKYRLKRIFGDLRRFEEIFYFLVRK